MQIKIGILALDNISWTVIKPLIDCKRMKIDNVLGVALLFRTLDTDPNTEVTIQSLQDKVFDAPDNSKLHASQTVGYGQLSAGSGNVKIECEF